MCTSSLNIRWLAGVWRRRCVEVCCALLLLSGTGCFRLTGTDQGENRPEPLVEGISTPDSVRREPRQTVTEQERQQKAAEQKQAETTTLESAELSAIGRAEFVNSMTKLLNQTDERMKKMSEKSEYIATRSRGRWQMTWETLQLERARLQTSFDELQRASDSFWADFRPSVMATHELLLRNLEKAERQFAPEMVAQPTSISL